MVTNAVSNVRTDLAFFDLLCFCHWLESVQSNCFCNELKTAFKAINKQHLINRNMHEMLFVLKLIVLY